MEAGIVGFKSKTGWTLVAIYMVAVAVAYEDYRRHSTQWLADIFLFLLTIPFTLLCRVLTGGSSTFEVRGADPFVMVPAILFCTCLVYGFGWAMGRLATTLRTRLR